MAEVKFALKCLGISILIILGLQLKVSGERLETKIENLVMSTQVVEPLQEVADGAALGIRRGSDAIQKFLSEQFASRSTTKERIERAVK